MPKVSQRGASPLTNPTGGAIGTGVPGTEGEGFYQGLVGRKTGRPAPRPGGNGRLPAHERILAKHGLIDQGAADPNQGQLFVPPQASPREMAEKHGVAPPLLASRPGFMPEVYEKTPGGEHISTAAAHKRMVAGIKRVGDFVDAEPGLGAIGTAMKNRSETAALQQDSPGWYARKREHTPENPNQGQFALEEGSSTEMVAKAARGEGVNYATMSRAVALTSPRTRWTGGTPGTDDYSAPNVESARNVVHDVKKAKDVEQALDLDIDYGEIGHAAEGRALGEHKAKAARWLASGGDTSQPVKIAELESQKVPNFDQSLLLGHHSQAVRRQAALSYTVDTHDVSSMGANPDLLKTVGGMAAARMTGRRSALKGGELPPHGQERVWVGQKSKTSEPMGEHSMLETKRGGKIVPRAEPEMPHISPQFDRRSDRAKALGLEF
jgi:hypothetical protein